MDQKTSRKVNSTKGVVSAVTSNLIKIIVQFIFRSIFIRFLGVEFLGVNSAISGVLNLLSVTELGISSAITFNLYKPVAEGDIQKVNSILKLFKKFYQIVACAILILGLCLLPFLKYLVVDSASINVNLYYVYVLYLLSTVATYFCSYRNVLFTAYQHQYKANIINLILTIVTTIIHIISILIFRNYYAYLVAQFASSILSTIVTYIYTKKTYPNISVSKAGLLDTETKKDIYSNIKGMFYHKISYSILQGTDSLVISSFIGATTLGIYSNYSIFTANIVGVFSLVLVSLAGSVGNLIAEGSREKTYSIYKVLKMLFFWMAGFCAIALFVLLNPTIELWSKFGKWSNETVWTLDIFTIFMIVLNFYLLASRSITGTFRESIGNFYKDRIKGIVEAVINLIVSFLLVKPLGIAGVLMGTIVSCLCTSFWVDPYMLYKYHFKKPLLKHFIDVFFYTMVVTIAGIVTWFICRFIPDGNILNLIYKCLVCVSVPNVIILLCLMPTKEFKCALNIIKDFFKKKQKNT